jgi:hypothetical protein
MSSVREAIRRLDYPLTCCTFQGLHTPSSYDADTIDVMSKQPLAPPKKRSNCWDSTRGITGMDGGSTFARWNDSCDQNREFITVP